MAVLPGSEAILEAARLWKERCLLADGSVLVPDRQLWSQAHLDELQEHFVDNPKLGKEHFLEKLEEQLRPASAGGKQVAAEFLWVMMLFPLNFSPATKVQKVRTVWEWSGEALPESPLLGAPLEKGIGSVGPGFINHQPFELKYLIIVVRELKGMPLEERRALLDDPWRLAAWVHHDRALGQRQSPHMLSHLLHPDHFESAASAGRKQEILKGFGREEATRSDSPVDLERALLELRTELEAEYPDRPFLDFHRPPLVERWQVADTPDFEFIEENLERARKAFLVPDWDFRTFRDRDGDYWNLERGYKEDLRRRFLELTEDLPEPQDLTEDDATRIVKGLQSVLTAKLEPSNRPQNLINWRYTSFLGNLDSGERMLFARAFVELLDPEADSAARAGAFVRDVWPLVESHKAGGYAASRSLPSFFLFLHDSEREIFIRTDTLNSLCNHLTGEQLFLNKRLDMNEYRKALAFAGAVRDQLEDWGWEPRDMIDVQTFMFVAEALWAKVEPVDGNGDPLPPPDSHRRDLQGVVQLLEAEGFHFPPELVANYVLALQTKRFVILTGISGTGKTQLAIRVGQFFAAGLDGENPEADPSDRVLVVAVRPDWTDPRGLLGYYNPITERYMGTGFLRLLVDAAREEELARKERRPARPYFVVLDEMNLARVEHYFSDFLSAMESEEALSLHHGAVVPGGGEEVDADLEGLPSSLRVPRNVFFTGTVNVDETTHMFSPKVLDRAFTLELNEVDLDGWALGETERPGTEVTLTLPRMEAHLSWHGKPGAEEWTELGELIGGRLREVVTGLNRALTPWGYHFGYRAAGEIARFVLLAREQGTTSDEALWAALDLALLQKVLPKFHGTEQELEPPLRAVLFVARHGRAATEGDEPEADAPDEGEEARTAPRLPRCAAKVERMLRQLRLRGFAAFIE